MSSQSNAQARISRWMPRALLAVVAVPAVLALAACAPSGGQTDATTTPSAKPSASSTPTSQPSTPQLQPDASAAENLAFFDQVAASVLAADPAAGGEAFVNGLVAAGFTKTDIEVGFDRTSVDLAADSVQWAVRFNGDCLIGQFGPASGGYHSMVTPILPTGTCLIGVTRPVDW